MVLQSLLIENFQTHESLEVRLDPAITTIVGPSDIGKSSVLRALRWVCLNKPQGDAFIRFGADNCLVSVKVDGRRVERFKEKGANSYRLDDKRFDAVAGQVPAEVATVLNVDDTTFSRQHDQHFWLASSPGEVSRALNSIVNLALIDEALAAVASELRDAKHAEASAGERLEQAEGRVAELAWVEDANKVLQGLEQLNKSIQAKRQESLELARLVKVGRNAEEAARTAQAQTSRKETAIKRLSGMAERYAELSTESTGIGELLCDIRLKEKQAATARAAAERLEVELAAKVKVCPICRRPMPSSP